MSSAARILICAAAAALLAQPPLAERARQAANLLLAGDYETLAQQFAPEMRKAAPPEALRQAVAPQLQALGAVKRIGAPEAAKAGAFDIVMIPVEFERGALRLQISFNAAGEIAGLFLRPPAPARSWQRPDYSRPDAFTERDVTAGAEGWPLPATLSVPNGPGPFPAVVLVHGSGPNDRDESVGAAKPFRDLAEGLASCGVAVLRYEKRTRHHAAKLASTPALTLRDEVIDDALAALALLRRTPGVDPRRVYLLGHSLGAWLAPVIAAEDGRVAGVILMAAPARPLEQLYVEQIRYLLSLDPDASAAGKAKLEDAEREAAAVRQIRETGQGPERALGAPRSYWLSFRGLDPLAAAARLPAPVFVLQGGRDYQVTGEDFRLWQRALEGKAGAQLKLYPALNHLFQPGEGPSSPAEYDKPGHVAAEVIGDLCQWILRTGGPAQRPATSPPR
ncbi:MAG: alpha/beta fold hydrolase [Bryobacteraceae bacterium]